MAEAPRQDLAHAGIVIGSCDRLDPELAVIAPLGLPVFIDDHGSHICKTADIRNIIGFHTSDRRQTQQIGDLFGRPDRAALLPAQTLPVPLQDNQGILPRKLHQLLFLPFFRDKKRDLTAPAGTQPVLQQLMVLRLHRKENLLGNKRSRRIKLLDKLRQDLALRLSSDMHHVMVLTPHKLSFADKKDLDNSVRVRVLLLHSDSQNIPVLSNALGHLLLLRDLLHTVQEVPPPDRLLKTHVLRGLLHFFREIPYDRLVISRQKLQRHINLPAVFLSRDLPGTWPAAAVHMKIQTGPVLAEIPGQHPAAIPQPVHAVDQLDRTAHSLRTGKRPEIAGLILLHLTRKKNPRILLPHRDLDIGICFIILEHRIVLGPMLLDQIILQNQSLQLRIRHYILKTVNLFDHPVNLRPPPYNLAKIRTDAIVKVYGLAHINNRILFIAHNIYPGLNRQLFQILRKIFHICGYEHDHAALSNCSRYALLKPCCSFELLPICPGGPG